jgi:hypothetical protein
MVGGPTYGSGPVDGEEIMSEAGRILDGLIKPTTTAAFPICF